MKKYISILLLSFISIACAKDDPLLEVEPSTERQIIETLRNIASKYSESNVKVIKVNGNNKLVFSLVQGTVSNYIDELKNNNIVVNIPNLSSDGVRSRGCVDDGCNCSTSTWGDCEIITCVHGLNVHQYFLC